MMFINSIFLPKNLSEQTMPEGISGKVGNFSHLFSNVFRIVKDEQNGAVPFQLTELGSENATETQNQLLNVSLLSDKKITLDNQNISSIIAAFLSKLNPNETKELSVNDDKSLENNNIPKYFSLNKNDFISEIKNIVDSLKKGDANKLENVSVSLISNGQSIQINLLTTDVVKLENWVSTQLETNNDFEILVKNGVQKLAVDVEPIKTSPTKSADIVQIITETDVAELNTNPILSKSKVENNFIPKTLSITQSTSQQPVENLKSTIDSENLKTGNRKNISTQKQNFNEVIGNIKTTPNSDLKLSSEILAADKNQTNIKPELISDLTASVKTQLNNELISVQPKNDLVVEKNILTANPKLEIKSGFKNPTVKPLSTSNNSIQNDESSAKILDTEIKNLTTETKIKSNNLLSDIVQSKDNNTRTSSEINVKELSRSENKIKVTSNQKFTSITSNKNDVKEEVVLNELLEKTNVKEIKVNVQKFTKTVNSTTKNISNEIKSDVTIGKLDSVKNQLPVITNKLEEVLSSKPELKQQTANKKLYTENIKPEKVITNLIKNDSEIIKTEKPIQFSDTNKVNNTTKTRAQQELFVDSDLIENENVVALKTAPLKSVNNNPQSIKENILVESDDKIKSEKNNLAQNKTIEAEVPKVKVEQNTAPTTRKIIPPELKSELITAEVKINSNVGEEKQIESNKTSELKEIKFDSTVSKNTTEINSESKPGVINKKAKVIEVEKVELHNESSQKESIKGNIKEAVIDTNKKNLNPEIKVEQKSTDQKTIIKTTDEIQTNSIIEKPVKESISVKFNSDSVSKTTSQPNNKIEISLTNTSEKGFVIKDKNIVENLRSRLKEFANDQVKQENVIKNQAPIDFKNNKIDFIQRRVYSQIPPIEVIADETKTESIKNSAVNLAQIKNENIKTADDPIKSSLNQIELKPKNEKQVWVKVSLEKSDNEAVSDFRKSVQTPNKITIETNNDGMKNNSEQNSYSEKDHQEFSKSKPQTASVESSQNTEVKVVTQNQTTTTQHDLTASLKPEIKIEQTAFKSTLHSEETKYSSRAAEMVEKIKVISAGEMIREVKRIFESGEKQSIVLRLVPKELGSVKVMLDTIDNMLTAKVEVENETVGQIVRNNVDQLKQNLLQSGVNLNSINISYQNSDQKQHGFNNHKRKNSGYEQNIETEDIDESVIAKKMGYNTYEYLA